MSDKTYDKLYTSLLMIIGSFLAVSFYYGQLSLQIAYPKTLLIALACCTVFIVLEFINYKPLYIAIPFIFAAILTHFTGIRTFSPYMNAFYKWLSSYGKDIEEETPLSEYSVIFTISLSILLCLFAKLLVRSFKLQVLTALLLFCAYVIMLIKGLYFFKRSIVFVFLYFLIILVAFSHMHFSKNKESYAAAKKKVINLLPSILIVFLLLLAIPVKDKPININIAGRIEAILNSIGIDTEFGSTGYSMSFSGYNKKGFLYDSVSQEEQTIMNIKMSSPALTNIYLIGNVFDTFDGREWLSTAGYTPQESTQSSTEDSFDPEAPSLIISTPPKVVAPKYSIDYYETAYAAMRYHHYDSKKAIASIINPIQLDITYNKFFTDCIFYPLKTKSVNTGEYETTYKNDDFKFSKKHGDKTSYSLVYTQINLDDPIVYNFILTETMEHPYGYYDLYNSYFKHLMREYFVNDTTVDDLDNVLLEYSTHIYDTYLQLPKLSKPVTDYIDAITAGYSNDIDKLKALEYTLSQYTYTTTPSITPSDKNFLERFLLDSKEGYCTYFATAFTLMARYLGCPARYVQGFCVPAISKQEVEVSTKNAHAWCEVYFRGVGWIPFEPTPSYATERYTPWDYSKFTDESQAASESQSSFIPPEPTIEANSGEHYNIDTDVIPELSEFDLKFKDYKPYILAGSIALAILLLPLCTLLVIKLLLKRAQKRYLSLSNRDKIIHNMDKLLIILGRFGIRIENSETLSEFYTNNADACRNYAPFLDEAVPMFEEIRYGNAEVTNDHVFKYDIYLIELLARAKKELNLFKYILLWFKVKL